MSRLLRSAGLIVSYPEDQSNRNHVLRDRFAQMRTAVAALGDDIRGAVDLDVGVGIIGKDPFSSCRGIHEIHS